MRLDLQEQYSKNIINICHSDKQIMKFVFWTIKI